MAGVHGLQHVECLAAAALAYHDAVGPHAQGVAHQVADRDLALALDVGRARLERHEVGMVQLQLGGILDRHDAFALGDEVGEDVEQGGLARAGAARDHHVLAVLDGDLHELDHLGAGRSKSHEILGPELALGELADGDARSLQSERRDHGIHARAVLQARIHHRGTLVDAPADRGDDALNDAGHRAVAGEGHREALEHPGALDEDLIGAVDHDLGHRVVREQRLEQAESDGLIAHGGDERRAVEVLRNLGHALDKLANQLLRATAKLRIRHAVHVDPAHVEGLEQPIVQDLAPHERVVLGRARRQVGERGRPGSRDGGGCDRGGAVGGRRRCGFGLGVLATPARGEGMRADLDLIAGLQRAVGRHRLAVHQRPGRGAEVTQEALVVGDEELGVLVADAPAGQLQIALGVLADLHLACRKTGTGSSVGAVYLDGPHFPYSVSRLLIQVKGGATLPCSSLARATALVESSLSASTARGVTTMTSSVRSFWYCLDLKRAPSTGTSFMPGMPLAARLPMLLSRPEITSVWFSLSDTTVSVRVLVKATRPLPPTLEREASGSLTSATMLELTLPWLSATGLNSRITP